MPEQWAAVEGREIWKWPVKVRSRVQRTWLTGVEHADLEHTSSFNLLSLSLSLSSFLSPAPLFPVFYGFPPFHRHFTSSFVFASPSPPAFSRLDRSPLIAACVWPLNVLPSSRWPLSRATRRWKSSSGKKASRPPAIPYRLSINEKCNRFQDGSVLFGLFHEMFAITVCFSNF